MPARTSKRSKAKAPEYPPEQAPSSTSSFICHLGRHLPDELVLEIISHFHEVSVDKAKEDYMENHLPSSALERTDTLRALSQIDTRFRAFFWPLLWKNVEIGAARAGPGAAVWHVQLQEKLVRICEGLRKNPHIATQVRGLRLVLNRPNIETTLKCLTSALKACSNLRTLNFYFVAADLCNPLRSAFKGHIFPSIVTAVVPNPAHIVLRSCPNATVVHIAAGKGNGTHIISSIQASCRYVEVLTGVGQHPGPTVLLMKDIVQAAPNLRHIGFFGGAIQPAVSKNILEELKTLKDLQVVEISTWRGPVIGGEHATAKPFADLLKSVFAGDEFSIRIYVRPHRLGWMKVQLTRKPEP